MSRTLISLFTDASFQHTTLIGGWGFWARKDNVRAWGKGKFKRPLVNSFEAEMCAIANSIVELERRQILLRDCHVLIQTDNQQAVNVFMKDHKCSSPIAVEAKSLVINHAKHNQWSFTLRWIKGHSSGAPRQWANNFADKLAGEGSRS